MKLCACGPMPVRPLPGYKCGRCDCFIIGPPKPNRDGSLHQTPRPGASRRSLDGIVGSKPASRGERAQRRLVAHLRRHEAQQRTPRKHKARRRDAVLAGPQRLDALIRRAEA